MGLWDRDGSERPRRDHYRELRERAYERDLPHGRHSARRRPRHGRAPDDQRRRDAQHGRECDCERHLRRELGRHVHRMEPRVSGLSGHQVRRDGLGSRHHDRIVRERDRDCRERIHTIHWGIQVGSDQAIVASNTITAADYGVYVLDPAQWPGVSAVGDTIFDTTYSSVANAGVRIPANFQGTVVDVGPGSRTADLTPVTFVTSTAATRIAFAWSGRNLNLSAMVGGFLVFDSGTTTDSQTLQAAWTGSVGSLRATGLSQANVGFQLTSSAAAAFDGSGFTPSTTYNLTRGGSQIMSAQSTSNGVISMTIPASVPS